ncbi:MAG TPA: hypothetical protein VI541_00400, partial [Actinomycetota bacterium]|nr:hypothetical protein [Actinomycetota bacterium]
MRRIAMLMALALGVVLALPALASYHDEPAVGFRTESCALGSNALPGSGNLLVVDPVLGNGDYTTIVAAVAAASANDYILVRPGTYNEAVVIPATKPGLRIRGTNRNTVILDGGADATHAGALYGFDVRADRVVIENMTAHNYRGTAFYWHGVTGYWGSHLTGYNTGGYGLYAYNARCGQFDHSFGSGNADSAFYIGECFPCEAVIHDVEATGNGLGYSGTNAGGELVIRDSYWHDNGLGI